MSAGRSQGDEVSRSAGALHYLYAPADQPAFLDAGATSSAGGMLVDLEDGVPEANKARARANASDFLRAGRAGNRDIIVRINDLRTSHWQKDLEALAKTATTVLVPKVSSANDILEVDSALIDLEARGQTKSGPYHIAALIETGAGVGSVFEVLQASTRTRMVVFGQADFTVDVGCQGILDDRLQPSPLVDVANAFVVMAAAAAGVRALVAPWAPRDDPDAQIKEMRRLFAFGYDAMVISTPAMVANVMTAYSPTNGQVEFAHGILEAQRQAHLEGKGATSYRGWLVEGAYVAMANALLARQGSS